MESVTFLVKGSSSTPYEVTFTREGRELMACCSCQSGFVTLPCRHRTAIFMGDVSGIVSDNLDDVAKVAAWFRDWTLSGLYEELSDLHVEIGHLTETLRSLEKKVARLKQAA